jgi:predicted flap endonuclease-1-like 5' DNA nuclease
MNFDNIWCWLIPLLVGAICALLGYLWGKGKREVIDNSAEIKALEDKNAKLKADLDACNKKLTAAPKAQAPASSLAAATATGIAFDAAAAKAAFGKRIKQDDLKIVEGIGPKIEGLFHNFDIKTWKSLSEASVDKCQEVLNSGGERYRIHDPASWPMQAKMAYEGKWKELVKWQDEHKAGKF